MSVLLGKYLDYVFGIQKLVSHGHRCPSFISPLSTSCQEPSATVVVAKSLDLVKTSDLNTVIAAVRKEGNEDELLQSLVHSEACNAIPLSHALIYKLLRRFNDDWKPAYAVFRWAQNRMSYKIDPPVYETMVDILGKAKQMDKMNILLEEMGRSSLITLNSMAKVMRRMAGARMWKDVVRMYDRWSDFGLEKSTESMNLLIGTLCKERMVELAWKIFLELKNSISPNAYTFNILVHGWCMISKVDEAHWTIEEMKKHGYSPCVITYSTIIKSYCFHKNFKSAYELLNEMQARGCNPNAVTFTGIMSSLADLCEYAEALQVAEKMKSFGCKPDIFFYNCLIYILGRAGCSTEAVRVFEDEMRMNGVQPNVSTYNTIIGMFFRHGDEERALHFLKEMTYSALCKPDVQTYHSYLKFCFKLGKTDNYIAGVVDEMVNKNHLSLYFSTYKLLIHGLCRMDKCSWAFRLFEEMISKGLTPRYQTCYLLLDKVTENNLYEDAQKIEVMMNKMDIPKQSAKGYRRYAFY